MLKILTALAVTIAIGSSPAKAMLSPILDPEHQLISPTTTPNARVQRKLINPVKLTVRHFPLHRIFANDDDDDSFGPTQPDMHHRRDFELELVQNISNDAVSDSVALRLWLIRQRALAVHQTHWG